MPSEDIETARAGFAAISHFYETGDPGPVRRHIGRFVEPDCEVSAGSPDVFLEGTWTGHDGMIRFMTNQVEAFEHMWIEPQDFIERDDWIVVPIKFGGRAKHTGMDLTLSPVHTFRMRDGRVAQFVIHRTLEDALAAIGSQARTDS
jgi:hypothetical protein